MFLFGKSKKNEDSLRKGTVDKVKSRIMAVPSDVELIKNPDDVLARAHDTEEIKIKSTSFDEAACIVAEY